MDTTHTPADGLAQQAEVSRLRTALQTLLTISLMQPDHDDATAVLLDQETGNLDWALTSNYLHAVLDGKATAQAAIDHVIHLVNTDSFYAYAGPPGHPDGRGPISPTPDRPSTT